MRTSFIISVPSCWASLIFSSKPSKCPEDPIPLGARYCHCSSSAHRLLWWWRCLCIFRWGCDEGRRGACAGAWNNFTGEVLVIKKSRILSKNLTFIVNKSFGTIPFSPAPNFVPNSYESSFQLFHGESLGKRKKNTLNN